ncbi:aminotransferase class V-fold PLP-dependent enzyme [Promethearchaeum syntrophicum]|uniref:Aminotransferase class V-fold PLP-dependent enzyme n=1 Tax=Promethearchaeum syntrophicum TaxID=2594042 RepID=A0A5B9D5X6_9ARCH|nr:aminotransferase class V-fold PLP-dependent enzyme [Candidatus Prometheoarchaeum syntrophicum]QEE14383.1 bifunctional cysteine desulfurase/selenocysteine lyase [Candidatus Prometheoarchaeum syntrophicum]
MKKLTTNFIRNQIIGRDFFFKTPYGKRLLTYADYTASGRSVGFIEKYLIHIQRIYANTHTEDDVTGRNMTGIMHRAEKNIKKAFNAEKNGIIIETGCGSTAAISKFQEIIGVRLPSATKELFEDIIQPFVKNDKARKEFYNQLKAEMKTRKPIIFVGPYEHHSNDIMWREAFDEVIEIGITEEGLLDLEDLAKKVSDPAFKNRKKIGSFSAASNVTGLITPVYEVARILHKHNALACFDFAASAPYVKIDMNHDEESYFDAVFISPHKFLGGPGSSGLLVFNKDLYNQLLPPTYAAGGTVDYVSSSQVLYTKDIETREKPGTPGILQIIKASLAINLKESIGIDLIEKREKYYTKKAFDRLSKNPRINILGNQDPEKRIAIFSFLFIHNDKYLHPKFATKLMNDLFGIQSRAGCSCAAVYGHHLLKIGSKKSEEIRHIVKKGCLSIKPGWTRINFHYTINEEEFDFICSAIEFVADYGYLFIPEYQMDLGTGDWVHRKYEDQDLKFNPTIGNILKISLKDCFEEDEIDNSNVFPEYLEEAKELMKKLELATNASEPLYSKYDDPAAEKLRWFYFKND